MEVSASAFSDYMGNTITGITLAVWDQTGSSAKVSFSPTRDESLWWEPSLGTWWTTRCSCQPHSTSFFSAGGLGTRLFSPPMQTVSSPLLHQHSAEVVCATSLTPS
ncbi:hypothetical protein BRARA_F00695 [Brassica rapa]|uniref:Uncharacterized protein n=1 Tax=Brassica campestris TaxID=3711 RepID=A0A397YV14_BRACM|nr:uncharacterized protein LOC106351157 [Brassica napus]RID57312.1 hypothetical protein BRARA_F00695 [Brassica rapa]